MSLSLHVIKIIKNNACSYSTLYYCFSCFFILSRLSIFSLWVAWVLLLTGWPPFLGILLIPSFHASSWSSFLLLSRLKVIKEIILEPSSCYRWVYGPYIVSAESISVDGIGFWWHNVCIFDGFSIWRRTCNRIIVNLLGYIEWSINTLFF